MRGFDAFAGVIKSVEKLGVQQKLVILNIDHPILSSLSGQNKMKRPKRMPFIQAGYNAGFNVSGGAYDSVMFQNANHSVRVKR